MKSNVSGEDFNLVLWDISNVCHSMTINADIAKIVLTRCTDESVHGRAGSCALCRSCQKQQEGERRGRRQTFHHTVRDMGSGHLVCAKYSGFC